MPKLFSKRAQNLSVYTGDRLLSFCQYCLIPPRLLMSAKAKSQIDAQAFYDRILATAQRFRLSHLRGLQIVAVAVEPVSVTCHDVLGRKTAVGFVSWRSIAF